ncbi:MAG: RdgB/HAM1 family non-canonical purine NTP pyrophosphatase [Alphaproteobacteria bacterium]|nr:RdgB/HAM1 family non-canonical purine NTP pyrophosphatase [Alphaproteobacteria bacterium]
MVTMAGRLVIATHNKGKLVEMAELLAPYGFDCVAAGALGLPEPAETASSFVGNAELKARAAAQGSGLPALADDSGIVVAALGGKPGIHSARWAETKGPDGEPARDFRFAMERVNRELGATADRRAHFVSVLCFARPDGAARCFEGRVDGTLVWPPRGAHGFGYDPMFLPDGHAETFGEMDPLRKHAISHRADAFRKLVAGMGWTALPGREAKLTVLAREPR